MVLLNYPQGEAQLEEYFLPFFEGFAPFVV